MNLQELDRLLALPLEEKIAESQKYIRGWYKHFDGNVYCSFSGGKDSTVLLHLVRSLYPEVPAVFSDTGVEFPEITDFVKSRPDVTWLSPEMSFREVLEKHGYPIISKEQSDWIFRARCGNPAVFNKNVLGIMPDGRKTRFHISDQWHYLLHAPFKIGAGCCMELKKKPISKYVKETGRVPFVGTMTSESMLRKQKFLLNGCNAYENKKPTSAPISFWRDDDIWEYLKTHKLPYSAIYDKGYLRTGCVFCMFGIHLEEQPNRIQRLQKTHPDLWRHAMYDWESGGLGMRLVLDYIGVPYENYML